MSHFLSKREKRIEMRNRMSSQNIWKEYNENETVEDIYKSFLKLKNILTASKRNEFDYEDYERIYSESEESIKSESESDNKSNTEDNKNEEEIDQLNNNIIKDSIPLLNRKLQRDNVNALEQINFEFPVDPLIEFSQSFGPEPIKVEFDKKDERRFYAGSGLKREEAELFAHYVKEGKRIPRRGEVGMSSEDIEKYESLGYVMSGVRNSRMNKARMKKEQILYTVEEKKALAIYNMEEKQRRERNIINEMKIMWKGKQDDYYDEEEENENNKQ